MHQGIDINDKIRQEFRERGGDVLIVEVEQPEAKIGPRIRVEDMKRPQEIFDQFHRTKFDDEPPDDTLMQTFNELVKMVEETE